MSLAGVTLDLVYCAASATQCTVTVSSMSVTVAPSVALTFTLNLGRLLKLAARV